MPLSQLIKELRKLQRQYQKDTRNAGFERDPPTNITCRRGSFRITDVEFGDDWEIFISSAHQ